MSRTSLPSPGGLALAAVCCLLPACCDFESEACDPDCASPAPTEPQTCYSHDDCEYGDYCEGVMCIDSDCYGSGVCKVPPNCNSTIGTFCDDWQVDDCPEGFYCSNDFRCRPDAEVNHCTSSATCPHALDCAPSAQVCTCPCDDDRCPPGHACDDLGTCAPIACEEIAVEQDCMTREDCGPLYRGIGCTCGPGCSCTGNEEGCVCESFEYAGCAAS